MLYIDIQHTLYREKHVLFYILGYVIHIHNMLYELVSLEFMNV